MQFLKYSDQQLQKVLDELQIKMENEVKEIEERYKTLKKPFVTILAERKTPGSPTAKPAAIVSTPLRSSPGKK